jgi:hypothetical protein
MNLSTEQLFEIAQYSFVRMDGAWFLALAGKLGKETAWEIDVEAWKQFSYVFGKKIRRDVIPHPVWPESFLDAIEILSIRGLFPSNQYSASSRIPSIRRQQDRQGH